ncbi:MAG: tRNA-dihydrouridine synthase [Candidatus Levybacteria bacterium]|nr:tRNA-dihydrouridine synthase [Candidatus Levybacteria bacterium]
MKENFWQTLQKPLFVQAPLDDVSDVVFREVLEKVGRPDVFFTEFTSTDGLCSKGKEKVMRRLLYTKGQRPIVAQIWGNNIEHYAQTAKLVEELGFDGIDINMGCPVRKVVGRGQCSGLIKNPKLAGELIHAIKSAAPTLPLSVKTRIGFNTIQTEEWIGFLLEQNLAALTVHGRIATRMSKDPANWEEIGKAVTLRNKMNKDTILLGNGDIKSREEGIEKIKTYGVDGVMIGRGIFTDLWIFHKEKTAAEVPLKEKLTTLLYHITLFEKTWGQTKDFNLLKKFYKVYINDYPNASEFRQKLMEIHTFEETKKVLEEEINQTG